MLIVGASAVATLKSFNAHTTKGEIVAYELPS
jgi:hypothetical protein